MFANTRPDHSLTFGLAGTIMQAMTDARRLVRHHPEHVTQQVHALLWDIVPMIDDLRSFVSKTALTFVLVSACEHKLMHHKHLSISLALIHLTYWSHAGAGVLPKHGQPA